MRKHVFFHSDYLSLFAKLFARCSLALVTVKLVIYKLSVTKLNATICIPVWADCFVLVWF